MLNTQNPFHALSLVLVCLFPGIASADWVTDTTVTGEISCFGNIGKALLVSSSNGVYASSDNGISWMASNSGLPVSAVVAFQAIGPTLLAGTDGDGVYASNDSGASWTASNTGLTDLYIHNFAVLGSNLFAGGARGGVFLSTDRGATWKAVNTGLATLAVSSFIVNGSDLLVFMVNGEVFKTTNNGASWTSMNAGLAPLEFIGFAARNALYAGTQGDLVVSKDGGKNWTSVFSNLPKNEEIGAIDTIGNDLIVAVDKGGVALSQDYGATWSLENAGLANTHVYTLFVHDGYAFAGTLGSGIWRRPISEITRAAGVKAWSRTLKGADLEFNRGLLEYRLPRDSDVSLQIVNAKGLTVASSKRGWKSQGHHTEAVDLSRIREGGYIAVLNVDGYTVAKRLFLGK